MQCNAKIEYKGAGVYVFVQEGRTFPEALACFKKSYPNLVVTAIAPIGMHQNNGFDSYVVTFEWRK